MTPLDVMMQQVTDVNASFTAQGVPWAVRAGALLRVAAMIAIANECPNGATFGKLASEMFGKVRDQLARGCRD